jgi:hypothetical protein
LFKSIFQYKDVGGGEYWDFVSKEELRTVGLGKFRPWFGPSENALRRQHNLPERGAYTINKRLPNLDLLIGEQ